MICLKTKYFCDPWFAISCIRINFDEIHDPQNKIIKSRKIIVTTYYLRILSREIVEYDLQLQQIP